MKKLLSRQSRDGTTIAFDRFGDGPPLILVLGALADRSAARGVAELLSDDFGVVIYDRRGRGDSGDTSPYSVEREIEDLDALITETGAAPFVFGHSSGAMIALEAAASGLAMNRLVVYEPPYIVGDTRTRPDRLGERVGALIASGQRGEALELFLTEGPEVPAGAIAAMQAGPGWSAMEATAHTLVYDLAVAGDQLIPSDRLARIQVPTLVLSGEASPAWARNAADAVAAAIPGAQHRSLDDQTHGVADDALAPVLVQFFLRD